MSSQTAAAGNDQEKGEIKALTDADREALVLEFRIKARKLGRSILRKWNARLDLEEVDSVVDLSLCEAVRRYDPSKGASFMTFLFYHLRGNLIRAVSSAANANLIPAANADEDKDNKSENGKYSVQAANAIEIAEALCSHDSSTPDDVLFKKQLVNISADACSRLDALEQEVIYRIYMKEQQLMDIASSLGYSRCHISRVKKKALEILHDEMCQTIKNHDAIVEEFGRESLKKAPVERRKVHRRRPRSKKALKIRAARSQQQQFAAAV